MQETFDFSSYARQVRKVSKMLMRYGGNAVELSGTVHLLTTAAERDLARFGSSSEASHVACGPGCGACCVLNVSVLFPEAVAITRFLQRRCSTEEMDALRIKLQELHRKICWLDDEERLFLREPCAFLDNFGCCTIHAVRPLLCRSITSTDPHACQEAIAMVALQGAPSVEMDLFHKALFDTVYSEFGWVLECLGFDHRPMRLSSIVLKLLDQPEMVALFVSGEKVPIH
jgi:Fe-S-cluster containining protein